jgi:hypothetical protein
MEPAQSIHAQMRLNRRDGTWLGVAVLLHALVLLLPLASTERAAQTLRSVTISLLQSPPTRSDLREINPSARPRPLPQPQPRIEQEPAPPQQTEAPAPVSDLPPPPEPTITASRLRDSLERFEWQPPAASSRRLGEPEPWTIPENWKPGIETAPNLFDDTFKPAKTEIVDRWVGADGTRNVVINTSGGDTYCGRAQSWDPMNPLYEPVMAYWKCAGGGKRAFRMPDRYLRAQRSGDSGSPR